MYRIVSFILLLNVIIPVQGQNDITWSEDIACLVYSHCTNCHNSNGVAPFPLESYQDAVEWKSDILLAVLNGDMPPWPAKSPRAAFVGDHSLTDEEIQAFEAWIMADTPEGDPSLAPEPPTFETNIEILDPEMVIELPEYTVPNLTDNDLYKCFVFPVDFGDEIFIKGIEVVPGNTKAVHHVLLYHDTSNIPINLDNNDPEVGYTCFGGIGSNSAQLIGGWAPGGSAQLMPDNMGIEVPSQTNLVVQVHYPSYAVGEVDQTNIRLKFTTEEQRNVRILPILNHFTSMVDGPLVIPPNIVREFNQLYNIPNSSKLTLIGIAPHAHLICNEMEAVVERTDGSTETLIHTPTWDFDWQKFYGYKRPIILNGGDKIRGRAVYDNTVNNHHNPNSPPETVTLGEDTDEEMMIFFLTLTTYQNGDEDLIFEEKLHADHVEDCGWELTDVESPINLNVEVFPNPASDRLLIQSEHKVNKVILHNMLGHNVLQKELDAIHLIDVGELPKGNYSLQMFISGKIVSKLIVIQ